MKNNIKTAFTIIEVSILFIIFLIVAMLVAPLSLDDTQQARNISDWKRVQPEFATIIHTISIQSDSDGFDFNKAFETAILAETNGQFSSVYPISFLNGNFPDERYNFSTFYQTQKGAVVAYKMFEQTDHKTSSKGILLYDVNGQNKPNIWGKDVFGFYIYKDHFEPFGKNDSVEAQKQDCSKNGTGLCCSNWYLIGGSFN